MTHRLATQYLL